MQFLKAQRTFFEQIHKAGGRNWPIKLWITRSQTRRQLYALLQDDPERLWCDLGLHVRTVEAECKKWFWQA